MTPNPNSVGTVVGVSASPAHTFGKAPQASVRLVEGFGIEGDVHAGTSVQHRSRVRRNASAPNLRQVHLMHAELFDELAGRGFRVRPGELGENVSTRGVDLLALQTGSLLRLGADAVVEVTGLRNPCVQIDRWQPGLMAAVLDRTPAGELVRKAGVMGVVVTGGAVRVGDPVTVSPGKGGPLQPV